MQGFVDTITAGQLTDERDNRVREKVAAGLYDTVKRTGIRGGASGESYLVDVSSLPLAAQILYLEHTGDIESPAAHPVDLAGYKQRFGDAGLIELQRKQRATKAGLAIRKMNRADVVEKLTEIAAAEGITLRTLYRWMDGYEEKQLAGIMKTVDRADKGAARSMCAAARQYAYSLFADQRRRTQAQVYRLLEDMANSLGKSACEKCIFNPDSRAREILEDNGEAEFYPPCADPDKKGMRIPECRQTLGRVLAAIPEDEKTLARWGVKAWKDDHMLMATRDKPGEVNRVWYGDHHQCDVFVLDDKGNPVRPWLTTWYDAASGCVIGWVLSTNPNTDTITEAFTRAVAHTVDTPFYGLPRALYIDNGKDYRSKVFEGSGKDIDLGYLNGNIAGSSVIQLLGIKVHHAIPYNAWSKTIERFFGTLEDIWIREVPGWCGNSPDDRPEDFSKNLKRLIAQGELWTMDEFYAYLRDQAMPAYHNRPHEGHGGKAPLELYKSLPRARNDQPDYDMLAVARRKAIERTVSQSGVKLKNRLYWHDAFIGLAGKSVTLRYGENDLESVSVILDNHFLCEATIKHNLQVLEDDNDVIAAHMSKQKRQKKETTERIRRASRSVFFEEVDPRRTTGTITGLEYRKAEKARKEVRERKARADAADPAREMLAALGESVLNRHA